MKRSLCVRLVTGGPWFDSRQIRSLRIFHPARQNAVFPRAVRHAGRRDERQEADFAVGAERTRVGRNTPVRTCCNGSISTCNRRSSTVRITTRLLLTAPVHHPHREARVVRRGVARVRQVIRAELRPRGQGNAACVQRRERAETQTLGRSSGVGPDRRRVLFFFLLFFFFFLPLDQLPRFKTFIETWPTAHLKLKLCHDEMEP